MRIAAQLGLPLSPVRSMDRMPVAEFALWQRYYLLEPWGPERGDLNAGQIVNGVASILGAKELPKLGDYLLKFEDDRRPGEREPQSPEEMSDVLQAFCHLTGGPARESNG